MNSAELLSHAETCSRKGYYSRSFEAARLSPAKMVLGGIRAGLGAQNGVYGEIAGSEVLQLAEDRGVESDDRLSQYSQVIHLASLSDLLVTTLRKKDSPAWKPCPKLENWDSGCWLSPDGKSLRRIVLVSNWTDERHYRECRSWESLGEVCQYGLPMQMAVFVIGQQRNGKRHSAWTTGLLHPIGRKLRFRKKNGWSKETFSDKAEKIWREDHAEISRETWLQAMLDDDVLPELAFNVELEVPPDVERKRIVELARKRLEGICRMRDKPALQFSTCDWPVVCPFRHCCHGTPEKEPSEGNGFVRE